MFLTGLQGKAVTFVTVAEPKDLDEAITKARKAEAEQIALNYTALTLNWPKVPMTTIDAEILTVNNPEAQRFINLSYITNTEKNISKWLRHIDQFRKEKNIVNTLDKFDNKAELDTFISFFISWLSKKDGSLFKVESVHNCYSALARYLRENSRIDGGVQIWDKYSFPKSLCCLDGKMKSLQYDGYGDTNKSDSLTSNEIILRLNHNYLSIDNNEGLIRRAFFWLSILCELRREKNNQGGVLYRQRYGHMGTQTIPITPDIKDNQFTPIADLLLYLSKRLSKCVATDSLFLQTTRKQTANGIWYKPVGIGANKLKVMLQQIAINIGINLDSKTVLEKESVLIVVQLMISVCHPTALLIPYATYNEDLDMTFFKKKFIYIFINYLSLDNNEIQGPDSSITNSSSNTISNTSSNTISNTSPNTISNDTILNANSNTVLNASSNTVSNASSNTVSNASSNNIVSNASSNTVLNASFNIMSNSSQPSVDAISNKIPLSKKCIIPISNLNPKLKTPFKVPQIYHQNQQKLPVKNKKQVIQTKETETTYAINNDREQISITNNKERKVLQHITNNIIIQIPDTSKPIDFNLKISFNN
ncbi:hypothetical protein C2G38_2248713 [Gigaspora rosea]|uniref:Uncharacterized protein n=1 Tax=Gigaspora rosea TaxID=44941 RepID=A0A397V179_9GLOM|nr:hypothetical protein C2G38_2248713 [Gigaspora rosea]